MQDLSSSFKRLGMYNLQVYITLTRGSMLNEALISSRQVQPVLVGNCMGGSKAPHRVYILGYLDHRLV